MDKMILSLRKKQKEKQIERQSVDEEIQIGVNRIPLSKEVLFGGLCSIVLPDILKDMDYYQRMIKYPHRNRPKVIKTDINGDATITFKLLQTSVMETDICRQIDKLCDDMKKVWKQNVFYDTGKIPVNELTVAWMDFRAFCIDGSIYTLLFIFYIDEQIVLGNFHCSFAQYDIWKPVILKLLTTIHIGKEREQ